MAGKYLKGLELFYRAYKAVKHEILVSVLVLAGVTVVFALLMYVAENATRSDYSLWDALVWTFVKYVEDPADVVSPPQTIFGQVVGTLVGVLGIAIFAVPAGLIGSGLTTAIDEEKHEKEIDACHKRLIKSFRRVANKSLREHLNLLPDKGGKAFERLNFVPSHIAIARLQVRQEIEQKEIFEVCRKYPDFRLKNQAEARSSEENPEDRLVLEHFPMNRDYGCCIDRQSKVTIVCTGGAVDCGISWFTYYLAKLGGFNFISKEIEIDLDEVDSFLNMSPKPLYDKKTRTEIEQNACRGKFKLMAREDKEALDILSKKQAHREKFIADLKGLCHSNDAWIIPVTSHIMNEANKTDIHFSCDNAFESNPTIIDRELYDKLYEEFSATMQNVLGLTSVRQSARYPLLKNNLLYRLREEGVRCNGFILRPAAQFINFNNKNLVAAFYMAQVISKILDNNKGIASDDIADLASTGFGYKENKKSNSKWKQ